MIVQPGSREEAVRADELGSRVSSARSAPGAWSSRSRRFARWGALEMSSMPGAARSHRWRSRAPNSHRSRRSAPHVVERL